MHASSALRRALTAFVFTSVGLIALHALLA